MAVVRLGGVAFARMHDLPVQKQRLQLSGLEQEGLKWTHWSGKEELPSERVPEQELEQKPMLLR